MNDQLMMLIESVSPINEKPIKIFYCNEPLIESINEIKVNIEDINPQMYGIYMLGLDEGDEV